MLVKEQVRLAFARQPDEARVVEFNHAIHFLVIDQPHAHRRLVLDEFLEVLNFLERLLRSFLLTDFAGHDPRGYRAASS